jgi:hypothetical protein
LPFYPSELPESEMETEKNVQELDCILIAGLSNAMRKLHYLSLLPQWCICCLHVLYTPKQVLFCCVPF